MSFKTIKTRITSQQKVGACRKAAAELRRYYDQKPTQVWQAIIKWHQATNPYLRITAGITAGLLTEERSTILSDVLGTLRTLAFDEENAVVRYGAGLGLEHAWFFQFEEVTPSLREWITEGENPLKRAALIAMTGVLRGSRIKDAARKKEYAAVALELIQSTLESDAPEVQSAAASAINEIASKNLDLFLPHLHQWALAENAFTHWILREALGKKLGKVLTPADRDSILSSIDKIEDQMIRRTARLSLSEAGQQVVYREASVQTMLHPIGVSFLPFRFGSNPYRGCEHNCGYCNARYTHEFLGKSKDDFARVIVVKRNAAEALRRDFASARWARQKVRLVNLGSVTDPYQPAEARYRITRQMLEVFLKFGNPVVVDTKSDLILRDLDLLKELAARNLINVMVTVSTLDQGIAGKIEPAAASIARRLEVIKELSCAGIAVGVLMIPILPYLTDSEAGMEATVKALAEAGAHFIIPDVLNIRGDSRSRMWLFLEQHFPELLPRYQALYGDSRNAKRTYAKAKINFVLRTARRYGAGQFDKMLKGKFEGQDERRT